MNAEKAVVASLHESDISIAPLVDTSFEEERKAIRVDGELAEWRFIVSEVEENAGQLSPSGPASVREIDLKQYREA